VRRYCGRVFSAYELALIRELIAEDPTRTRADLSRLACQRLQWYKADGGMKEMSCRVAMLRMQADGLIKLPPPRCQKPQRRLRLTPRTDPRFAAVE
jgi:DNA-binding transcriptional regulator PaaX